MFNVELTFDNMDITCIMTGDRNFNGTALGYKPRTKTVKFSGTLVSPNLDNTVSFQYNLGSVCSLVFFDATGKQIERLLSETSCEFTESGGGPGAFN